MAVNEVVLLGIGELVGVQAKALPRPGFTLHPVTRETGIAGLHTGANPGERWQPHRPSARLIAEEAITLLQDLIRRRLDRGASNSAMVTAFEGDPLHQCMGRSAPARLRRALSHGEHLNLDLPRPRGRQQGLAVS
ncbi:MAG: hypothetical protein ABW096_03565 [Candidatus Thiodiazotropha sp.]